MSGLFVRFSNSRTNIRIAALFGALLCLAITPFMASAAALVQDSFSGWSELLFIERQFGPSLESAGLITFGEDPDTPYQTYGKAFFLTYLGIAPVLYYVRPIGVATSVVHKVNRVTWQAMFLAAFAALVGDFVSYWGQSIPGEVGDQMWGGGFGIEMLSLLVLIVSTLAFAATNLIRPTLPRWVSIVLILGVFALAPSNALLTDYWPNGLLLPITLAWLLIAFALPVTRPSPIADLPD